MIGVSGHNKNIQLTIPCLSFIVLYYIQFPEDHGVLSHTSCTAAQHIASCMCVLCCQKGKWGVKQIYPSVKSKKAPQWVPEGVSGNQAHIN